MSKTNFNLLTDHFKSIKAVCPTGGLAAGEMVKVGGVVGVAVEAADAAAKVVLIYEAEAIRVDAAAFGAATAAGALVYFDATNKEVTVTATGNTLCGILIDAAALSQEFAIISLYGTADLQATADAARYAAHA